MSAPWWDNDYNGRTGSDSKGQESRVYVGNLPYRADERSLKDSFSNYGAVSSEVSIYIAPSLLLRSSCFRSGWVVSVVRR